MAINYKVEWERELERRRRFGIVAPDPLPHPDHVRSDFRTGDVEIHGPMSKQEQAELEVWRARKADFEVELQELREMLETGGEDVDEAGIREEITRTERVIEILDKALPRATE